MLVKQLLTKAYAVAVEAAHPGKNLAKFLPPLPKGRLLVVGAGKAAATMAQAVEAHYPLEKLEGLVITRYGHNLPTQKIEVVEAAHPVPDKAGELATGRILDVVSKLTAEDLLLCLISGGGSALLSAPEGLDLRAKAELTQQLLASGADIKEMNTVRKHLSRVKGGRLLQRAYPARVVSLILSDVVGDDLSSIASGPTVADPSSYAEALAILRRYDIQQIDAIRHFEKGIAGQLPESPKADDPIFSKAENILVASGQKSLEAVADFLRNHGLETHILSSGIEGEAREAARFHAAIIKQILEHHQPFKAPCALISGGETTVTVKHKGKGGRNGEFALSLAIELAGTEQIYALVADTDGIDGSEHNAGVLLDPDIFAQLDKAEARAFLNQNNSFSFFEKANALLVTGPTHTNVNDLRIIVITEPKQR